MSPRKSADVEDPRSKPQPERTKEQIRHALRAQVRYFYDLQRLRIQSGGRGKSPEGKVILTEYDLALLTRTGEELNALERQALGDITAILKTIPFYTEVLLMEDAPGQKRYKGIGPTMAAVIISEFNIPTHDTVSKMWALAGLSVVAARRCKSCHQIVDLEDTGGFSHAVVRKPKKLKEGQEPPRKKCDFGGKLIEEAQTYTSGKAQRPTTGQKLPYNAWLRTKLVGVLAPVMLKVGSPWRKVYDDYKHRKETAGWGTSKGHRHTAAMRYMIKMMLQDIWERWRTLEGLPVRPSYAQEFIHDHLGGLRSQNQDPVEEEMNDPEVLAELQNLG